MFFHLISHPSTKNILFVRTKFKRYGGISSSTVCGVFPRACPSSLFLFVGKPLSGRFSNDVN